MRLRDILGRLFGSGKGHDLAELARRLGLSADDLQALESRYREFTVPKRGGGMRRLAAPEAPLKVVQRVILRRLLGRLRCHPAAHGFERGRSIVTNALPHARKAVVLRMDLQDFFAATSARRVRTYFRAVGWNRQASDLLVRLCTWNGGLAQGAPTSPRVSNLVNFALDRRLTALARRFGAAYTRYADDLTFSFDLDDRDAVHAVIRTTKMVVADYGYTLHQKRKLHIRRRHDRQEVTGLVVNEGVRLPREWRRWLRAVEHHIATGRRASLSAKQLGGWRALAAMVRRQGSQPESA